VASLETTLSRTASGKDATVNEYSV